MSSAPESNQPAPDDEASDPLWALLDRAREIPPSAQFARRVLTAVQAGRDARARRWDWVRRLFSPTLRPAVALASVALLLAGGWWLRSLPPDQTAIAVTPPSSIASPAEAETEEVVETLANELALLEDVDALLAPEDNLDLDEEDVDRLLF